MGYGPREGRRSRIPKHRRLQGSTPPEPLGLEPTPFPRVPGSPVLGQRARGSRSQSADAAAGASSKQTLPAPPGAQLPGPSRAGRGRTVPRRQPAARPPGPAPVPWRPLVSPRSGRPPPGADPLGAGSGQPGSPHTSTCAPPSARPAFKRAPPTRALFPSLVHEAPDATGVGAGARDAGALFPGCLISRRAP